MPDYKKIGFKPADILIPENVDMTAWSVVACDQYTSQPDYWKKAEAFVGDKPSTLNMVFPEVYLSNDNSERIKKINSSMEEYLPLFKEYKNSMVYVERVIALNDRGEEVLRRGIIGAVDLEAYDYSAGSMSLIRATEGTVLERIPPRVEIRKDAILESPHIMILIDDPERDIIESVYPDELEKIYDFDLMMQSGHIYGYLIKDTDTICEKLEKLVDKQGENPLLFAMGDGNHSLATAKACWEEIKKGLTPEEMENHPARFALAEIVNIHESSMEFEPIHRVLFDIDPENVISEFFNEEPTASFKPHPGKKSQTFTIVYDDTIKPVYISDPSHTLAVGTLQKFLDKYIAEKGGKIDYIHGRKVVSDLTEKENTIGFILPPMDKSDLFPAIKNDGVLPRKTFSIGESFQKRFYLECRKIK